MKALKMSKWLLLITGILMTFLGISMLFTPYENIVALATLISIVMLLSGISGLIIINFIFGLSILFLSGLLASI